MSRSRNTDSLLSDRTLYRQASFTPARWPSERPRRSVTPQSPAGSPSPSQSSDKENRSRTNTSMADSAQPPYKRRRTGSPPATARQTHDDQDGERTGSRFYDPDQPLAERQQVRKDLRDLNTEAVNMRAEWIKADNDNLKLAIRRADDIMLGVKQTSEATIDSRFLVTAGDITYRKTAARVIGDSAQSIDLDEFVSKCISFMRRGERRDRGPTQIEIDDDTEDPDDGLDWNYLGTHACLPYNSRPPVPGFLLGPLSVQKRVRKVAQRRANQQRVNIEETRPDELQASDLNKAGKSDLTKMCQDIHHQVRDTIAAGMQAVDGATSEEEAGRLAQRYGLDTDTGGLPLFKFALNPRSFGQSVENLFYLSFLIRDGWVGIDVNSDGQPSLLNVRNEEEETLPESERVKRDSGKQRHQAVLSIDFETWQGLCEEFDVKEPMIPHREDSTEGPQVGRTGWY